MERQFQLKKCDAALTLGKGQRELQGRFTWYNKSKNSLSSDTAGSRLKLSLRLKMNATEMWPKLTETSQIVQSLNFWPLGISRAHMTAMTLDLAAPQPCQAWQSHVTEDASRAKLLEYLWVKCTKIYSLYLIIDRALQSSLSVRPTAHLIADTSTDFKIFTSF